jgi:hypothetical protein
MTLSIMTLSLKGLFATLSIIALSVTKLCIVRHFAQSPRYTECRASFLIVLSAIVNVVILSDVLLNVVALNVKLIV